MQYITTSPYLLTSNALAERSVGIIKKLLEKSEEAGTDPYIALLYHRKTPK